MQKRGILFIGTPVGKKSFIHLFPVNSKRIMFGGIGRQSPAVFILVLVVQRLIHIPNAPVAIQLLVD